jgi:hypothetical protein
MIIGGKFWTTFRVVVLLRGFSPKLPHLSLASFFKCTNFGGSGNVLWCG